MKTALVTNATGFAGPPAVDSLLEAGYRVLAHDRGFLGPGRLVAFSGRTRPAGTAERRRA